MWSLVFVVLNLFFIIILLRRRRRRKGEPPLVSHVAPFIGGAFAFGNNPVRYLKKLQEKHGDVYTIKLAGWNYHVFMSPLDISGLEKCEDLDPNVVVGDFVTRMVGSRHSIHNYESQSIIYDVINSLGRCLIGKKSFPTRSRETEEMKVERNKSLPHAIVTNLRGSTQLASLCKTCIPAHVEAIKIALEGKLAKRNTIEVGLYKLSQELIFDVTFNLMFGSLPTVKERNEEREKIFHEFCTFFKRSALLVDRVPIHLLPETKKARGKLFELLAGIDWSKRNNVSNMIEEVNKLHPQTDFRVRHLLVILWAAQANTLPAFFWTLFYIAKNPEAKRDILQEFRQIICEKNKQEIDANEHLESNGDAVWPKMVEVQQLEKKDLDKLVTLDSILKEVMRITGSSLNIRRATKDTSVACHDGIRYRIREGDYTAFYAPFMHFDPEIFENPKDFIYDRFIVKDDASAHEASSRSKHDCDVIKKARSRFYKKEKRISASRAIMTFGFGATRCPGRHIAMIEIKLLVLSFLNYFDLILKQTDVPDFDLTHVGFGVMPPKDDVVVTVALK